MDKKLSIVESVTYQEPEFIIEKEKTLPENKTKKLTLDFDETFILGLKYKIKNELLNSLYEHLSIEKQNVAAIKTLTDDKKEIAWYITQNLPDKIIGKKIGYSKHTVKSKRLKIYEAVKTASKTNIAVLYLLNYINEWEV